MVVEQMKQSKNTIASLKMKVQETKQKTQRWQQDRQRLEQAVTFACHKFSKEGITLEILLEDQVINLGEVDANYHQCISELETKSTPSTPPEVLEA